MEASNRVFRYGHSSEVRVSVTSSAFVSGWTMKATSVTAVPKADDGPTCSVAVQAGLVSSSSYSCTQKAQAISRVEMARFAFASPSGLFLFVYWFLYFVFYLFIYSLFHRGDGYDSRCTLQPRDYTAVSSPPALPLFLCSFFRVVLSSESQCIGFIVPSVDWVFRQVPFS